ncbi:hypothetical protein AB733_19325 [Photobacterium swingsii]|uniref:Glycosyltransferase 2-like domain-containing protein n=1 Tax=Photobacterium swingsii TaxID=680026 RepID=A0A0J8V7I7_9GAMM|nr:glycosyltransferase [Photobacterium swingsii]KMV29147.1 hypothetical protein AB733_19325 [Photobacterium swingsii]PSW19751.1 hypothetical protein C9I94_23375 [Photobacterium swingsii]
MPKIQICVFAYNLEHEIEDSIRSIIRSLGNYQADIYIMVNGCKDNTENKVKSLAKEIPPVHMVKITLGDKSNAWNTFTHNYCHNDAIAIFVDGDVTLEGNAINNLINYHLSNVKYNAITGVPWSQSRSSKSNLEKIKKNADLAGNLYLLSPFFINKLKSSKIYLPIGLIGDDSMIAYLSATNLEQNDDKPKERTGYCIDAVFQYTPLSPLSIKDIKLYLRRRVRYSIRYMQQSSIVPILKAHGLSKMPTNANKVDKSTLPPIRWRTSNIIFDIIALRVLKQ